MCWLSHLGHHVSGIKVALGVADGTVRLWITHFNAFGVEGLRDRRRGGRPATYSPEQVGELIAASLTNPQELGLPFASWTLDRLATYLNEERGIAMQRSRIGKILPREGWRWRTQETWFGARPDPAFAAKGGDRHPLRHPTRRQSRNLPRRDGTGKRQVLLGSPSGPKQSG
jgi:transposase